jgi:hypothetical protein
MGGRTSFGFMGWTFLPGLKNATFETHGENRGHEAILCKYLLFLRHGANSFLGQHSFFSMM